MNESNNSNNISNTNEDEQYFDTSNRTENNTFLNETNDNLNQPRPNPVQVEKKNVKNIFFTCSNF